MQKDVKIALQSCAVWQLYKSQPQHVPFNRMPDPRYPHQIVSMDITGPFTRSERGNIFLLNFVDHLTGWADCYPLGNKRGETVANVLQREFFPRYGFVETLVSDNGTEFVNSAVKAICTAGGVEHRTTTPYRPQANAKVERFHRTLKGILERLMAVNSSNWESQLGPALMAYRGTVSGATNYTPFQALYGRQMRIPQTKALQGGGTCDGLSGDRVATLARVWAGAREALRNEREANELQQRKKRLSGELRVGDSVIVLIPGTKRAFQPRWDARWQVIRARHPVYWIRHLPSGREKVLHREKLRWVPPDVDWGVVASGRGENGPEDPIHRDDGEPLDRDVEERPRNPDCGDQTLTPQESNDTSWATGRAVDGGDSGLTGSTSSSSRQTEPVDRRRRPERKRRPPRRLGWEDWQPKRGRLAALDFWCFR